MTASELSAVLKEERFQMSDLFKKSLHQQIVIKSPKPTPLPIPNFDRLNELKRRISGQSIETKLAADMPIVKTPKFSSSTSPNVPVANVQLSITSSSATATEPVTPMSNNTASLHTNVSDTTDTNAPPRSSFEITPIYSVNNLNRFKNWKEVRKGKQISGYFSGGVVKLARKQVSGVTLLLNVIPVLFQPIAQDFENEKTQVLFLWVKPDSSTSPGSLVADVCTIISFNKYNNGLACFQCEELFVSKYNFDLNNPALKNAITSNTRVHEAKHEEDTSIISQILQDSLIAESSMIDGPQEEATNDAKTDEAKAADSSKRLLPNYLNYQTGCVHCKSPHHLDGMCPHRNPKFKWLIHTSNINYCSPSLIITAHYLNCKGYDLLQRKYN
uniref:Uncharacterized protein n=1 Tax=Panagrolaimus sp. ES5 TaxID=591445 RepID=A0AC34G849_9BILA